MKELHERFFALRNQKEQLTSQLKDIQEQLDQVEADLVLSMENTGLSQIKTDGGTIYLRDEVYARVADPALAFSWLRNNGFADVIKETCHARTLSSIVKDNGEVPGVEASFVTKCGYRRVNGAVE